MYYTKGMAHDSQAHGMLVDTLPPPAIWYTSVGAADKLRVFFRVKI